MLRSRGALLEALLALLEEKPFDQITIRDITARADVGYATFFRHYPTKEALLEELASDEIAALLELSVPVLYETGSSRSSTIALFTFVDEHRKLWTALLTGGAAGILREAFLRQAKLIPMVSDDGSWLPRDLGLIYATTATIEIIAWWLRDGQHLPVVEIAEILNRLVISPTISTGKLG